MYCPMIYHDATRWATAKVDWRLIISSSAALTNDPPAFLVHGMHSPNNPSALHVAAPPAQPVAPSCTCQLSSLLLRQTTAAKSSATPEPSFANQYAFHRQFKGLQGPQRATLASDNTFSLPVDPTSRIRSPKGKGAGDGLLKRTINKRFQWNYQHTLIQIIP